MAMYMAVKLTMVMYMGEDIFDIEDVLDSKNTLNNKIKQIHKQMKELDLERIRLMKAQVFVNKKLRKMCNHTWKRENYVYSELYCSKCGVFK